MLEQANERRASQKPVVNFLDSKHGTSSLNVTIDIDQKRTRNSRHVKTSSVDTRVLDARSSTKSMYYSIYDEKFDKVRQYNHDARQVLNEHKKTYNRKVKAELD